MLVVSNLARDFQYAFRTMRNSPGFTAVAVLSLALGIGANTAIFSLIDAVLLRALPVADPNSIVLLSDPTVSGMSVGIQTGDRGLYTYPEYVHLRDHNQVLASLAASQGQIMRENVAIGASGSALEPAVLKMISANLLPMLGVQPAIGRFFTEEEDRVAGGGPVAVISYDYWKRRFGLSPGALGQKINVHRASLTVVGVAPQGFRGEAIGESPDIWIPLTMQHEVVPGREWLVQKAGAAEKYMWLRLIGRMKPGVDQKQAKAALNVEFRHLLEAEAAGNMAPEVRRNIADSRIEIYPGARGASSLRSRFSEPLFVLMAVVGLVLLIACANVANLLLARSAARRREIAIRLALGAGRGRLLRQLLAESVLLSFAGGLLGVLFAVWSARALLIMASRSDSAIPLDIAPDVRLLAFAFAVSLFTALLFGVIPALRAIRVDVNPALKDNARGVIADSAQGRGGRFSLGKSLVALQVAISLLLLIGAGLFARTLSNLASVKLGYDPERLLMISMDVTTSGYKKQAAGRVYEQIIERIRALPGVRGASVSQNGLFFGGDSGDRITVEGYNSSNERDLSARFDQVGPGYFKAVGIPVILGREFEDRDGGNAPHVCLINETMAKFYFGGANPIGKHVRDEFPDTRVTFEIIGVVKDAKYGNVREKTPRRFYIPFFNPIDGDISSGVLMVRTNADPGAVMNSIRHEIAAVDSTLSIDQSRTAIELVNRSLTEDRLIAQLSTFFGVLALMLACIGLYGVMSYAIARRTSEIGIRVALGASRSAITAMVLRESLLMVAVGMLVGIPAAIGLSRLVESRLYGLKTTDPVTVAGATMILVVVAATAALVPALRASRVDPIRALRYE